MEQNIKNSELRNRAIANANEILKMEEPPAMTTYLWCKVQSIAESMLAEEKMREREKRINADTVLYKSVMNQKRLRSKFKR